MPSSLQPAALRARACSHSHPRLATTQEAKLQAKLRQLGGAASAALLAIPTEQLRDLRATSEAKGAPRPPPEVRDG